MFNFTRAIIIVGLLLLVGTAFYASTRGVGLPSFNNRQVLQQAQSQGGSSFRNPGYFSGRTVRGGGPRYGK